jgi:hypothetical protein
MTPWRCNNKPVPGRLSWLAAESRIDGETEQQGIVI